MPKQNKPVTLKRIRRKIRQFQDQYNELTGGAPLCYGVMPSHEHPECQTCAVFDSCSRLSVQVYSDPKIKELTLAHILERVDAMAKNKAAKKSTPAKASKKGRKPAEEELDDDLELEEDDDDLELDEEEPEEDDDDLDLEDEEEGEDDDDLGEDDDDLGEDDEEDDITEEEDEDAGDGLSEVMEQLARIEEKVDGLIKLMKSGSKVAAAAAPKKRTRS